MQGAKESEQGVNNLLLAFSMLRKIIELNFAAFK